MGSESTSQGGAPRAQLLEHYSGKPLETLHARHLFQIIQPRSKTFEIYMVSMLYADIGCVIELDTFGELATSVMCGKIKPVNLAGNRDVQALANSSQCHSATFFQLHHLFALRPWKDMACENHGIFSSLEYVLGIRHRVALFECRGGRHDGVATLVPLG